MKIFTLYIVAFIFIVSLCILTPQTAISEMSDESKLSENAEQKSHQTDREKKAYEVFEKILILSGKSDDKDVFQEIEALYLEIIREYSDTALAQECYWRLVMLYVEKSTPPMFEKAENLYAEFLEKYPKSVVRNLIVDSLSKSYLKNGNLEKVLELNAPLVEAFYATGELSNPSPLFMYAEAQFKIGNLGEAEKAYKSLIESFPNSRLAYSSKKRLDEMQKKEKTDTSRTQ